jgi:hypothetical protein
MLACDDELRIRERDPRRPRRACRVAGAAAVRPHPPHRFRVGSPAAVEKILRLPLVLLEIRTWGQIAGWHTNLLSPRLGVRRSG